ncbi:uncharacterized protein LOC128736535 [Sabethes cyaneus]|uniref:uncharacterized protein LOC128736535 n=1 Tax=Sabethes cyaneus TaxID=53552 RepID=UPI00237D552E|nr:uncharacterized protein LOC128736535 [Sabethes cyaneus]
MFNAKNLMNVCRTCLNYFDHHSSVPVDSVEESSAKSYRDFLSEWHTGYTTFNNQTYEEHLPQQVCQDCAQRIDGILQFQTETVFNLRLLSAIGEAKLTGKCTLLRKLLRSEKYRKTLCKLGQIEQDNILSVDDLLNVFDQSSVCHATIKKEITEPPKEGGLNEKNDIPIVYGQLQEQTPPEGESDLELDMKFEVDDQEGWAAAEGDEPSTVKQPKKHASGIRKKPCLIEGCEPIVVGQAVQHVKEKHRTYCKICGLVFGSYTRATSHVAIHRPAEHRFSCELCPKCRNFRNRAASLRVLLTSIVADIRQRAHQEWLAYSSIGCC